MAHMNKYFIGYVVLTNEGNKWSTNTIIVQQNKLTFQQIEQLEQTLKEETNVAIKGRNENIHSRGPEKVLSLRVISIYKFEE